MRIVVWTGIAALWLSAGAAHATELQLKPRLCLHAPQQNCQMTLTLAWQTEQSACLFQPPIPAPLLCGQTVRQQLPLSLTDNQTFELRAADGTVLASRFVRVLEVDFNAGDQLLKRTRASWGTP